MGVVYRAHDERLGRDVALKLLPPTAFNDENARKRFHKEARVLARLNHPNIATVFDFDSQNGIDFLVTEYIPGETLASRLASGTMPTNEVLRVGMQLADGLVAAHEAGVLHRDLKPANLQLTPDGRLKILDFGLAQLSQTLSTDTTQSVMDLPMAGTLPYQAPEQLRGEQASARSDIYAAGAVLYEMCTGRRAFANGSPFIVIENILHEMPKRLGQIRPGASLELEQVVMKCLDKQPENRYESAVELGVDLRRVASVRTGTQTASSPPGILNREIAVTAILALMLAVAGAVIWWAKGMLTHASAPVVQSVAVLPLKDYSAGADQEYFADGMTEELITDLAQISALRVISRTSMMTYKGSTKSLPQIAKELNVDAVLEGSVERFDHHVKVQAKLIRAQTDVPFWTRTYERNVGDILTLQEDVAKAIADEIQIKLTAEELRRLNKPRAVNPEAHENYLRGRYYWNQRTNTGVQMSVEYLQKAIAIDPHYALAYAALSDSYHLLPELAGSSGKDNFEKARSAAQQALRLDPSSAEAHAALAKVMEDYDWNWDGAESEYRQAIELNSGLPTLHAWYSNLLTERGRVTEALSEARKAQQLDPLSSYANSNLALIFYYAGQYEDALAQSQKTLALDPANARSHRTIGCAYAAQQSYNKAIPELKKAIELSPGTPEYIAELGYVYAVMGQREQTREILNQLESSVERGAASAYSLAVVYAGTANRERTLQLLQQAVTEKAAGVVELGISPLFKGLRRDPAFQEILKQLGLFAAIEAKGSDSPRVPTNDI